MTYRIGQRSVCRICGGVNVRSFLRFAAMPLTDAFVSPERAGSEFLAPIEIFWCADCMTTQTLHDVEVSEYYREYRYTVSTSGFARNYMERLAAAVFERFALDFNDSVIEIGSSDGYQLACFNQLGARVLGYEPSAELTRMSRKNGVPVVQRLFNSTTTAEIPAELRPVQVVLLTYTFDHLPDPLAFLESVRQVLDPVRGVLVIEVHDLDRIMERRETCLFEHEHSIYLTALTMARILERAHFRLLADDLLPDTVRRGNSLLIAAAPQTSGHATAPTLDLHPLEKYDDWRVYDMFACDVETAYVNMRSYVHTARRAGKRIAGYGAGGRGVMTLAMADLNQTDIAYVCDQNTEFHGLLTPRSHIPIFGPGRLQIDPVDEIIVFSFGYLREIQQQLAWFVQRGGKITSMLELFK